MQAVSHVVHLFEELGGVVEGVAVLGDRSVELLPPAFDVVHLPPQPSRVTSAVAHHTLRRVGEPGHLAVDQVGRLLELFERLRRQLDRRQ